MKGRTGKLVNLAFSARHFCLGADPGDNEHNTVLLGERGSDRSFYTPSAKTTKAIFEDNAGEMTLDEYRRWIGKLKERKLSYLVLSPHHPYGASYFWN